jgi:hypothetical protein
MHSLLAIFQVLGTLGLALMGLWATLWPPRAKSKKHRLVGAFVIVGLATAALSLWSSDYAAKAQEALRQEAEGAHREAMGAKDAASAAQKAARDCASDASASRREATDRDLKAQEDRSALSRKLEGFMELAKVKYPALDENSAVAQLLKDMQEIKDMTRPVTLSFGSCDEDEQGGRFILTFHFTPTKKDEPFGDLVFQFSVPHGSNAKILSVENVDLPAITYPPQITPDGTSALYRYRPLGGPPTVRITTSERSAITVSGNKLPQPCPCTCVPKPAKEFHPLTRGSS